MPVKILAFLGLAWAQIAWAQTPLPSIPYAQRNDPEAVDAWAHVFCAYLDTTKPGMQEVHARMVEEQWTAALAAFRDYYLDRVASMPTPWQGEGLSVHAGLRLDDLMQGRGYTQPGGKGMSFTFSPGTFPWGRKITSSSPDVQEQWQQFQTRIANVDVLAGPLLEAYGETGDLQYLRRWEALTDDWAMRMQDGFDAPNAVPRFFFHKNGLQQFGVFITRLKNTLDQQPALKKEMDPVTLARLLWVAAEEFGPVYWWTAHNTVFNHNHNALIGATYASYWLNDLKHGQRLEQEMEQHWRHTWTYGITRDGSMTEIGDDGHLAMAMRLAHAYHDVLKLEPPWADAVWHQRFKDMYEEMTRFQFRHLTPNGLGHRGNFVEHFGRTMNAWVPDRNYGGHGTMPMWVPEDVLNEPEIRAVADTVWGRARAEDRLSRDRKYAYERTQERYPGAYQGPPRTRSHFMPYAGLYYLRTDWSPDADFAHLFAPQPGHENSNINAFHETALRVWGYGFPLWYRHALHVGGQSPHPDYGRLTLRPGGKTDRLTAAPEKPADTPWLSNDIFDVAIARYEGVYQNMQLNKPRGPPTPDGPAIKDVRTDRHMILIRPLRLWVSMDRVQLDADAAGGEQTIRIPGDAVGVVRHKGKPDARVLIDRENNRMRLVNKQTPGLRVFHSSPNDLELKDGAIGPVGRFRTDLYPGDRGPAFIPVAVHSATRNGRFVLATLFESLPDNKTESRIESYLEESSPDGVAGFNARIRGEGKLGVRMSDGGAPHILRIGNVEAVADLLIMLDTDEGMYGLLLGARAARMSGQRMELPAPDVWIQFGRNGAVACTPLRRPLDPPTVEPSDTIFIDECEVTLRSASENAIIVYTLDGSDPLPGNASTRRYVRPFTIREDTWIKARALHPEWVKRRERFHPFDASGVDVSAISYGRFTKAKPKQGMKAVDTTAGWRVHYVEAPWYRLFAHLGADMWLPVTATHTTETLLDPDDVARWRQTDGPYGLVYQGTLEAPETGVYAFIAPDEYVKPVAVAGYELRIFVEGEELTLGREWHGLGRWSVALEKGNHPVVITFADARDRDRTMEHIRYQFHFPLPSGLWPGIAPELKWTGP